MTLEGPLLWTYGAQINEAPPVAPAPIATLLNEIYVRLEFGPGQSVQIIAAATLLAGVVELVRAQPALRLVSSRRTSAVPPVAR